jgi:hypothetical protein
LQLLTFLQISTAVIGLASGVMFAHGAARIKTKQIYDIAVIRLSGINRNTSNSLIHQKADYIVGSSFLVIAFCLQILLVIAEEFLQTEINIYCGAALSISICLLLFFATFLRYRRVISLEEQAIETLWEQEQPKPQ